MSLDPSTIGRYKVLGTLGAGAMGMVYLAEDPRLKRPLAIKTVREGTGDAEVLHRFKREAEISAQLNHPNAITVFDVGDEPGLGPYLVMEYVEGDCLSELISQGLLTLDQSVRLLLQANDALEAVHALGIVHRDIKPENFMVAKDGRLKLMDFGIARGNQGRLTATTAFLGTPAYAAPEVLNGARATEASDRWSFTLTAFEMLTGRLPFSADSVGTMLYRIVHEEPDLSEGLSAEEQAVFRRAFDKVPARRHPDLRAFLQDLLQALPLEPEVRQSCLSHLEAPASGTPRSTLRLEFSPAEKDQRFPSREPWIWAGVSLALFLGTWALFFRRDASRILSIESRPSGAEVFLDGTALGRTPLREVVVKGKAESLRLEKPEFLPLVVELKKEDRELSFRLQSAPFPVTVATDPPGAEVFLDGRPRGLSPMVLEIPGEGSHQVRVQLMGFQPWNAVPERHKALPDPIHLLKQRTRKLAAEDGKFKKFFKGIFQK